MCAAFEPGNLGFTFHTYIIGEILSYSRVFCLQGIETSLNKLKSQREMYDLDTNLLTSQGAAVRYQEGWDEN